MRKELEDRRFYAKRKDRFMYVTAAEHAEMLEEITPLKKSTIVLWEHVPVQINDVLAVRQAKEVK